MNDSQNFLITFQRLPTMLDVLEHFTKRLEERSFPILDMQYLNSKSTFSLLIRLEISDSVDKDPLRKELNIVAKKYQLDHIVRITADDILRDEKMIDKAIIATRQLCKRQSTWLRNENNALILKKANIDKVINFLQ